MNPIAVALLALLSAPGDWTAIRLPGGASGQCTVAQSEVCLMVSRHDDPQAIQVIYPGKAGHRIATLTGADGQAVWNRSVARATADDAARAAADTDDAARAEFLRRFGR